MRAQCSSNHGLSHGVLILQGYGGDYQREDNLTAYQAIVDEGITFIDTAEVRHALQHASDCTRHTIVMPCDTWKGQCYRWSGAGRLQ